MDNKKLIILGGIILLTLIIFGVVVMLINNRSATKESIGEDNQDEIENLIELSGEDVGLSLSSQKNNQQLVMELADLSKVESFEYELTYDAIENGETVSRGTFGSGPNPDEKNKSIIRRVIDLGTCSSGACKYDKGVEKILLELRINLKSGEAGIIEKVFVL